MLVEIVARLPIILTSEPAHSWTAAIADSLGLLSSASAERVRYKPYNGEDGSEQAVAVARIAAGCASTSYRRRAS